ncbi:YacL family protein [Pasteurellaceae bacterium HPA106]|uniref:YacL family protein n=1 Tax=Spirabiliibacterium pneumoniae TaxID=221400 RepID=UPI001AAC469C|nr:YacL family protein [Spirabiliibacterium pneumoniae]MBE2896481.1 YacL family protein [Spirabiliibacterium pneumoniae]
MDYQFAFDAQRALVVTCSMGHEALARWACDELPHSQAAISALKARVEHAIAHHTRTPEILHGHEFDLSFDAMDVCVQAHALSLPCDALTLDDTLHEYDAELIAYCGSDDFVVFLDHLQAFLAGR